MTDNTDNDLPVTPPVAPDAKKEADAVVGMQDRDIKWRAKYKASVNELETAKIEAERKQKALETKLSEVDKARELSDTRRIEAEVKALAVAEGLTDLDLIKLIDTKGLTIDENGEVVGAKQIIEDFKSRKPAFFGSQKKVSSSTNATVPTDTKTQSLSAYDIPDKEWSSIMRRAKSTSM